jgi:hypothetical protein
MKRVCAFHTAVRYKVAPGFIATQPSISSALAKQGFASGPELEYY